MAFHGKTRGADPMTPSGVGLVFLNSSLRVIYANTEAARILGYPGRSRTMRSLDHDVGKQIRSELRARLPSLANPSLTELYSGKRRYLCRAFLLRSDSTGPLRRGALQPSIAVLMERGGHLGQELLAKITDQYHLTRREHEILELLVQGPTSKEIAARMHISPNTVKAFLRLIMLKMGVSTRSAIIGKIVATEPLLTPPAAKPATVLRPPPADEEPAGSTSGATRSPTADVRCSAPSGGFAAATSFPRRSRRGPQRAKPVRSRPPPMN